MFACPPRHHPRPLLQEITAQVSATNLALVGMAQLALDGLVMETIFVQGIGKQAPPVGKALQSPE
jgi:hypothetical protein